MDPIDTIDAADIIEANLDDNGWLRQDSDIEFVKSEVDEDGEPVEVEEEEDSEEESEEDTNDEEVDSEDEESEEGSTEEELFEIEIDGETYEVNKEELYAGYLRNEELAKRRAEVEEAVQAKETELETERQRLVDALDAVLLEGNVTLQKYRNVDWEGIKATNPEGYKQARLEYIEAQEQQQQRESRRNAILQMQQQAQAIKHQAYLQSQHKLAAQLIPELKEEGFADKLVSYGKTIGYTEEDIRSISDAKSLFILNQARLYAESQVRKKAALEKKVSKDLPPVVKPGAPKTNAQEDSRRRKETLARLGKTKSVRDAAAVLLDFV